MADGKADISIGLPLLSRRQKALHPTVHLLPLAPAADAADGYGIVRASERASKGGISEAGSFLAFCISWAGIKNAGWIGSRIFMLISLYRVRRFVGIPRPASFP